MSIPQRNTRHTKWLSSKSSVLVALGYCSLWWMGDKTPSWQTCGFFWLGLGLRCSGSGSVGQALELTRSHGCRSRLECIKNPGVDLLAGLHVEDKTTASTTSGR
ncbi:hypothetical protein BD410DRAFT_781640 [Rickenella mellea]|uniref:Uncharacterized protein n=1 Tax=Rickenella mellea TaxID=50990 RepID=A0A4Y7QK10_9AGAM|nr:hypothetical protein BD410DRAFT_781640 [Rickenella mellea]